MSLKLSPLGFSQTCRARFAGLSIRIEFILQLQPGSFAKRLEFSRAEDVHIAVIRLSARAPINQIIPGIQVRGVYVGSIPGEDVPMQTRIVEQLPDG